MKKKEDGTLSIEKSDTVETILDVSPEPADYIYKLVKINGEQYSAVRVPNVVRGGQTKTADPMYFPVLKVQAKEVQEYKYRGDVFDALREMTLY